MGVNKGSSNLGTAVVLFLVGCIICFSNGFTYMHPMDQSIVFDGAWRLICGQRFIQDFATPIGFVPMVLQASFFKLLGVNWTAYCIHAAVLNGLFVSLVFSAFRLLNANMLVAFYFALLSGVVFYAPMATPFADQHAFFFSFAAIVAVLGTSKTSGVSRAVLWVSVPVLGAMALLSKQIPSAFLLFGVLVLLPLTIKRNQWKTAIGALSFGTLLSVLLFLCIFPFEQLANGQVWETVIAIPSELGKTRWSEMESFSWSWIRNLYLRPFRTLSNQNFWDSVIVLLPILMIPIAWFVPNIRRTIELRTDFKLLFLLVLVHVSSSQFIVLTGNQKENGIPFIFLTIGLAVVWLLNSKVSGTLFGRYKSWIRVVSYGLCGILFMTTGWEAWEFHQDVNRTRKVLDAEFIADSEKDVQLNEYGFDGVEYNAPWHHGSLRPDSLVGFLKRFETPPKVFLWGDMSLIYGLSDIEPISPVLWMHSGLTFPDTATAGFVEFRNRFSDDIITQQPDLVVFEHHSRTTSTHVRWSQFPKLEEWLRNSVKRTEFVGGFEVYYLK